jgi:hypothetical protein
MSASDDRSWVLGSETHRQFIGSLIAASPAGWVVKLEPPSRTGAQNRFLHALLADIAEQLVWPQPPRNDGELHDREWWKRRCTLQWLIDTKERPEVITNLQGDDFAILLPHTSDLTTAQCASLSEWILGFGGMNGVVFRDPKRPA